MKRAAKWCLAPLDWADEPIPQSKYFLQAGAHSGGGATEALAAPAIDFCEQMHPPPTQIVGYREVRMGKNREILAN